MNFRTSTADFRKALSKLQILPGASGADEASHNVQMGAGLEGIKLFRFSSSSAIRTNINECTVIEEGTATVTFELLNRVITSVAPGEIEFKAIKEGVEILGTSGRSVLKGVETAQKPPPRPVEPITLALNAGELSHAFKHGLQASATTNQAKPECEGVLLKEHDGKLYLCGTDGRRLHISIFKVSDEEAMRIDGLEAVLTKDSVQAASKLLGDEVNSANIRTDITPSSMILTGELFKMAFALCKLPAPNFVQFAKRETKPLITVNRMELLSACKAASAFATADLRDIRLTFTKKYIQVVCREANGSEFEHKIAGSNGVGTALDITVNWDYMSELLESVRGDQVTINGDDFVITIEEADKLSILCKIRTQ